MGPANRADAAGRIGRSTLLIEAAAELFTERSYDEVTTTEIAKKAGVAYGLIAHHFGNKRGLYLATLHTAADTIRVVHEIPPVGETPAELLRDVLGRHLAFVVEHAAAYTTLMRGGSGSDPEVRAIIEDMRWQSGVRLLRAFGASEPIRPALRTAMHGWIGYFDETVLDHIEHRELEHRDIIALAVAALISTLRTAHLIDPDIGIDLTFVDQAAG